MALAIPFAVGDIELHDSGEINLRSDVNFHEQKAYNIRNINMNGNKPQIQFNDTTVGGEGVMKLHYDYNVLHFGETPSTPTLEVHDDGTVAAPQIGTDTGSTQNLVIQADGSIVKESSSKRYKENIRPLSISKTDVLSLEPKSWTDIKTQKKGVGLIAEDVHNASLQDLVVYENNTPESVQYRKLSVYLLDIVKEQEERITELERQMNNER